MRKPFDANGPKLKPRLRAGGATSAALPLGDGAAPDAAPTPAARSRGFSLGTLASKALRMRYAPAAPATAFTVARTRSKISSWTLSMSVAPFESGS